MSDLLTDLMQLLGKGVFTACHGRHPERVRNAGLIFTRYKGVRFFTDNGGRWICTIIMRVKVSCPNCLNDTAKCRL